MAYIYTQLVNCICTCRRVHLYVNSFLFLPSVPSLGVMWQAWGCMCSLGKVLAGKGAALEWYLLEVMGGCFLQHHKGHFLIPWEFCPKPCCPFWPCPLLPSAGAGWSRWQWCSFSYNLTSQCSVGNERGLKTISPFCCTLCPSISLKLNWARTSPLFLSLLLQGYLRARRGLCLFLSTVGAVCREGEATRW